MPQDMTDLDPIEELIRLGVERGLIEIQQDRIKYVLQGKEYNFSDPEEKVRAATYVELVEKYQYSPSRIDIEVKVPRRTPNDYADIVVYADDDHKDNYIVVENKRRGISEEAFRQAIEQGFGNANSLRAAYLLVSNFDNRRVFIVRDMPPNERQKNIVNDLPVNYGLLPTYFYKKGGPRDLRQVSFDELASKFQKCHDIIWSGGKVDPATAFDEMSKIIFAKIQDERHTKKGKYYKFQVGRNENEVIVAQRVISLYNAAREVDPHVFTERITIPDQKVYEVVKVLQDVSLTKTDIDAKGQAFEKFLGTVFRGGLGQYFTRRQIVEFMVDMLEPNEDDVILDPSCGSGGFLLYALKRVITQIKQDYEGDDALIARKIFDFSHQRVYGIEINAKIARVAMMDMIINDDGHTNIENNTALNREFKNPYIAFGKFSLVLTNPPFGLKIKRNDKDALGNNSLDNFTFGRGRKSQLSDILFLEQYANFLTNDQNKNPRAGVVLQVGVLNNPSNKPLLDWLRRHFKILAVVSLPEFAFRKAGSGMKTALLFVKKYAHPYDSVEAVPDYKVFFAIANHIGYDSTLRPDKNDLPRILEMFKRGEESREEGVFWLKFSELDYRLDPRYYYNKFIIQQWRSNLESKGFVLVPLRTLLRKIDSGKSPRGGVTRSVGEVPSITVANITRDGTVNFEEELYFVPESFYEEFNKSKGDLEMYDILVAKDGATTGKTAMIDERFPFLEKDGEGKLYPKAIFSEHVFRLRVKEGVNPAYINAFLNSEMGQLQLETVISGGAQGGITREFADNVLVPLIKEQDEVAKIWEEMVSQGQVLRRKYLTVMTEAKKKITQRIEEATPLSKEDVEIIVQA